MEQINESKKYQCYFCEEIIIFAAPTKFLDGSPYEDLKVWRHEETDAVACKTVATPSNMAVEPM